MFGILGNVLKVLPGYAQILFTALQDVTGALEAITGSGAGEELLKIGLALHGAVIWGGLAVTVFLALVKVGLIDWVAGVVVALGEMVSALAAGQGAMILFDLVAAINPFVLLAIGIGAVVAGAVALVTWLGSMKSASDQLWSSIEKNVNAADTFAQANTALSQGIQQANTALASTPKYIDVVNNSLHGVNSTVTELNPAWAGLTNVQKQAAAQQQLLGSRMDELDKITGSAATTTSDLSSLNVKAGSIATMTAGQYAILKEEILGLATATVQLAGYTAGPAAAAQNALTNLWLNEQLPAIQKITQAEDNLVTVVTGSQVAFDNFQQSIEGTTAKFVSPSGLADAAALAKGNLSGINQQSLAFANTLYTQSIPSLQKLVDGLQQQSATTQQLTTVVATGAGQMLDYTGKNTEARAVIVALINNALGPGTVSLQTLNTWVKNNSTSLTGMNAIVAQSTIKAGTLASVLQNNLTVQFRADLLASSGATAQMKLWTDSITNGTSQTAAGQSVRAKLITDLTNTGLSSKQATGLVDGLQTSVNNLKGKTVDVGVLISGGGNITFNESTGVGSDVTGGLKFLSGGGRLGGFGGGDMLPALLEPGETVVDKMTTRKFAQVLKAMGVPGFAAGGAVGSALQPLVTQAGSTEAAFGRTVEDEFAVKLISQLKASVAAAAKAQAAAVSGGISSAGVSNASAEMALASAANKMGWGGSQWAALFDVEMREAGFSLTATNPTSGAYGMAQFIGGPAEYAQYGGSSTTAAGQATAMVNYIAQRYGNPQNAWNHELAYGWYDGGGWLPPGRSIAVNNTGQPERVTPPGSGKLTAGEQAICSRLDALISVSGQQGGKFAGALNSLSASAAQRGSYSTRR